MAEYSNRAIRIMKSISAIFIFTMPFSQDLFPAEKTIRRPIELHIVRELCELVNLKGKGLLRSARLAASKLAMGDLSELREPASSLSDLRRE